MPRVREPGGDRERRDDAGDEVAGGERQAGERGAARARERHHRERVPGEALAAQHHEPAGDRRP